MGAIIEVKYFNSFLLKKTNSVGTGNPPSWNGSRGIPEAIGGYPVITSTTSTSNWIIEEARIRGGYNNTTVDLGVRAYLVEEEANAINRVNSIIYSGIFNSRTGINNTNVFSVGESITKSADPANGSIQKLYAEDTNLVIFQESKVSRALIDKDAIYSAEGGGSITNINTTIGTIQPFAGNFGISKDPSSFATYGYRKYFTDKDRNAVLRLSMDGLTEISNYGMYDYFRDQYSNIDIGANQGVLIGGWDIHNKQYVLSAQTAFNSSIDDYSTLSFDEDINGWTSFFSYKPDSMLSLKSDFYSLKNGVLWKHYDSSVNRGNFYGWNNNTSVQFIFNPKVSMTKVFKTINYEGSNGWQINNFVSSETGFDTINGWSTDTTALIYSYDGGKYVQDGVTYRAGFDRKENKYVANLVNNTQARDGEIVWGDSMSGIKGFFATVSISTDYVVDSANGNIISGTNPGGAKELFAVSSIYSESSY